MMARRSSYQIRSPPKEVFPESTLSPGGLQLTTLFWDTGIVFHQGSHAGARVGNNFEVFGCITTREPPPLSHLHVIRLYSRRITELDVSAKCNAVSARFTVPAVSRSFSFGETLCSDLLPNLQPPHPSFWRRIPSPGSSFSLTSPITTFTSTAYQGGVHRVRHHPFPRSQSPHAQLPPHLTTGTSNEHFSPGRTHLPIRHDEEQRASSEGAVHHSSETGLGPAQNGTAPGSPIDRPAGNCRGAAYPNVSMGNSSLQGHNRNPPLQIATGHDRTGVGGIRNGSIDMSNSQGSIPPPAGHPSAQPA